MLLPFRIFSKSQHQPDDHLTIITFIFNLTCAVLTVLILWISECTFFKVVGVLNGNGRVRKSGTGIYIIMVDYLMVFIVHKMNKKKHVL